jgi:hypothetical protein
MADFTQSQIGGQAASGVSVPVAASSGNEGLGTAINTAANLVTIFGKKNRAGAAARAKLAADEAKGKVLGDFSIKLSELADLRDTGQITPDQAEIQKRKLHRQTVAQNSVYTPELNSIFTGDLGDEASALSDQEKAVIEVREKARENGYFSVHDDDATKMAGVLAYERGLVISRELEEAAKVNAALKAEIDLGKSQDQAATAALALEQEQLEVHIKSMVDEALVTGLPKLKTAILEIAGSEAPVDQKVQALEFSRDEGLSQLAVTLKDLDPADREARMKAYEMQYNSSINGLINENGLQAIDNSLKLQQAQVKSVIFNSPEMLMMSVIDAALPNSITTLGISKVFGITEQVSKLMKMAPKIENGTYSSDAFFAKKNPVEVTAENSEGNEELVEVVQQSVRWANSNPQDEQAVIGSTARVSAVLDGVAEYQSSSSAKNVQHVVDLLASPDYAKLSKDQAERLSEKAQEAAVPLFAGFQGDVMPLIEDQLLEGVNAGVRMEVSNAGIRFVDATGGNFYIKNELDRKLKPVLNKYLRAFAHLDGTTDYAKFFKESGMGDMVMAKQQTRDQKSISNILRTLPDPKKGDIIGGWKFMGGDKEDLGSYKKVGKVGIPMDAEALSNPLVSTVDSKDFNWSIAGE